MILRIALGALTGLLAMFAASPATTCSAQGRRAPEVACLLEDNAEELLPKLTNPQGDAGEGHVEREVVFAGKSSVRIVPMQRYDRLIPGWAYVIAEKPKAGEYRYLRFAWRATAGCTGIMLQLHDEKDWRIRYTAGADMYGWGTRFVAEKPPEKWTVVTVDLFKNHGPCKIQGMALTCFNGAAGYFDHIYFGRSVEDLDRIDATDHEAEAKREWTADELEARWQQAISQDDASAAYRAFWSLTHAKQAVPLLTEKLRKAEYRPDEAAIKQWITELDDDKFATRQAAAANLTKFASDAVGLLEEAMKVTESAEVRARIKQLLARRPRGDSEIQRGNVAIRILEMCESPEAKSALAEVANVRKSDRIGAAAIAALKRLEGEATSP